MSEEFLSFDDILKELQIDEEELKRMVTAEEIKAYRYEDNIVFKREDVEVIKSGKELSSIRVIPELLEDEEPQQEYPVYRESVFKKIKNIIAGGIGCIVMLIFFFYFQIFGVIHAFEGHGASGGVIALFIPPVAWYRAVEYWWHDDFAGVDWDKRLEYDGQACIGLIGASCDNQKGEAVEYVGKIGQAVDEFSKQISKYPNDKKEYLKKLSTDYILYIESLYSDLIDVIKTPSIGMRKSQITLKYEDKLKEYPFVKDQIELVDKLIYDKLKEVPKENWETMTPEEHKKTIEAIEIAFRSIKNKMRSTYKNIFNEELKDDIR